MNVKVKMPNFRKPKNGSSVTKELLMSVIGTTISIVLTFGTAYLIDNHQRKAEGHDIAMMVIHDIDQYVEIFRDEAKVQAVAIDKSGNKVELTNPEGISDGRRSYLIREKEK